QTRGDEAIAAIEAAKKLAPAYAEVYRVEGWAHYFAGNYAAARQAYETALELEPRSAVLRYWYAGFLLRAHDDAEAAAEQLKIAQQLDANAPEIRIEYSRALSYLYKFDEADEQLQPVIETADVPMKLMRVAYDGWIQISRRRGNFFVMNADYLSAL